MDHHPTTRQASPHAWRRLRKALSPEELRDIARDIAAFAQWEIEASDNDPEALRIGIQFALINFNWEGKPQA